MSKWSEAQRWKINCFVGCGVFLIMEVHKWFYHRRSSAAEISNIMDIFTFLKYFRIIPVFETALIQFSLSAVGGALYAFEPRVPLLLPAGLGIASLLLSIVVPVSFLEATERREVSRLMAFCFGYLLGPPALAIGPCSSVSVYIVLSGTLTAHIWCLRNFLTFSGYTLGAQVIVPFFVIPLLLGCRHACGMSDGRLTGWVGCMYAWGVVLHLYTILCARWDQKLFEPSESGSKHRAECTRVICRDATAIFTIPLVGLFFGVRSVWRRIYRRFRIDLPIQTKHLEPSWFLRDWTPLFIYGLSISALTLYTTIRFDKRI